MGKYDVPSQRTSNPECMTYIITYLLRFSTVDGGGDDDVTVFRSNHRHSDERALLFWRYYYFVIMTIMIITVTCLTRANKHWTLSLVTHIVHVYRFELPYRRYPNNYSSIRFIEMFMVGFGFSLRRRVKAILYSGYIYYFLFSNRYMINNNRYRYITKSEIAEISKPHYIKLKSQKRRVTIIIITSIAKVQQDNWLKTERNKKIIIANGIRFWAWSSVWHSLDTF